MTLFIFIQNSGLAFISALRIHGSQLMWNLPNQSEQYSKCQIRAKEIKKCLDEGLEPSYHLSTFSCNIVFLQHDSFQAIYPSS